jgi:hypothetical protein
MKSTPQPIHTVVGILFLQVDTRRISSPAKQPIGRADFWVSYESCPSAPIAEVNLLLTI